MKKSKNFLKRSKNYLILMLLLVGFTHCQFIIDIYSDEDNTIAPEILPYFEMGDTLIYKSGCCVDSFYVEKIRFYAIGEGESDTEYERFYSTITQINCSDSCYEFRSSIRPWEYYASFYGFEYFSYRITENDKRYYGLTRKVGNYQLKDLYRIFNYKADTTIVTGKEIAEAFYSKKYGFIEYVLTNGEVFQIDEDCLTMLMARE